MGDNIGMYMVGTRGIAIHDDKILLLKWRKQTGELYWDLPGGRLDVGESPEEALRREISEELPGNTVASIDGLVDVALDHHLDGDSPIIMINYRITLSSPSITISPEHTEFAWLTASELETLLTDKAERFFDCHRHALQLTCERVRRDD